MFGNILIDKFRCYFQLTPEFIEIATELKIHIETTLEKHFAKNAYNVTLSQEYGKLSIEFTPTRYFQDIKHLINYTDTNLDMSEESSLYELFEEILSNKYLRRLLTNCKITKLDLTKNFLMKKRPYYYLEALLKRNYKKGYKAISCSSRYYSKTVSITTLARNAENKDTTGDRELKFYNKVEELKAHHLNEVILKNPLTEAELNIPELKLSYIKQTNTLKLNNLNILRVEWQFEGSKKLSALSKYFEFDGAEAGLYLKDLLQLMKDWELYSSLDNFYTEYTLGTLNPKNNKKEGKLNVYTKILSNYYNYVVNLPLKNLCKDYGLYDKYNKILLAIQNENEDKLFKEIIDNINKDHKIPWVCFMVKSSDMD